MNWLTNLVRPKIQALMHKNEVPDNLWDKCDACEHMLFHRDLVENSFVCHQCQNHMRMDVQVRLESLFDNKTFVKASLPKVLLDPLKFKDSKRYTDRLKDYRQKTGRDDAIVVASGKIGGQPAVVAAFDFSFMGGSMGMAVGEGILTAADLAINTHSALIVVPASGGARMQEGVFSLMQMPRTTIAVERVREAGLPYIVILTNPTTGGVSASFAMLGDVTLSEPQAIIGFAGARVIEETIRQKLPEGFQRAEYLLDHGMVDMVVHRHKLAETVGRIIGMLNPRPGQLRR